VEDNDNQAVIMQNKLNLNNVNKENVDPIS